MYYTTIRNELALNEVEIDMEFMNRGTRPNQPTNGVEQPDLGHNTSSPRKNNFRKYGWWHITSSAWWFSTIILIIGVILSIFLTSPRVNNETKFADPAKLQAVFLNGGQVYFGRFGYLNSQFMTLSDIYYLRVNQQVQPGQANQQQNEITLAKLGCELHGPQDRMVINHDQIVFWENLKSDGQVAKAVGQYKKDNPGAQKCDQPAAGSAAPTATTPATTPPAKKP